MERKDRIQTASKLFPHAQAAKVVIVGSAAKIKPQLEGLGKVTVRKAESYR